MSTFRIFLFILLYTAIAVFPFEVKAVDGSNVKTLEKRLAALEKKAVDSQAVTLDLIGTVADNN